MILCLFFVRGNATVLLSICLFVVLRRPIPWYNDRLMVREVEEDSFQTGCNQIQYCDGGECGLQEWVEGEGGGWPSCEV